MTEMMILIGVTLAMLALLELDPVWRRGSHVGR